jgi:hypothetical protein
MSGGIIKNATVQNQKYRVVFTTQNHIPNAVLMTSRKQAPAGDVTAERSQRTRGHCTHQA